MTPSGIRNFSRTPVVVSESTVDAVPGMQSGARLWNLACLLAYLPVFVLWPVLAALTTSTNYGGAAEALDWLPGIDTEGSIGSGVAALAWIGLPIAVLMWAMLTFVPWLLNYIVFLPLGALYLLAVGYVFAITFGAFRAWWILWRSDVDSLLELSPGPTQVTGRVTPVDGTVEPPYTGTESLLYESRRERLEANDVENRNTGSHDPDTGVQMETAAWNTKESESDAVPFVLRGDGGAAYVETSAADTVLETDYTDREDDVRRVEDRLEPNDDVYVSGVAVPAEETDTDADSHRYVISSPESELSPVVRRVRHMPFIISERGEAETRRGVFKRGIKLVVLLLIVSFPLLMGFVLPLVFRAARSFGLL